MAVEWEVSKSGSELVIRIIGRFDFSQYQSLQAIWLQTESGLSRIVLDLAEVSSMDSSVLGMLLELYEHTRKIDVSIVVVNCSSAMRSMFETADFGELLTIE